MYKNKSIFLTAILLSVVLPMNTLSVFAEYVPAISSNEYTTYKEEISEINEIHTIDSNDKQIAKTNSLELYLNPKDLSIKVKQLSSDYVYSSNDVDTESLNEFWQNYVNSPIVIKYIDANYKFIQETLGESPDSKFDYETIDNGFKANLYFGKSKISLSYSVTLEGNEVVYTLNNEDIIEGTSPQFNGQTENVPFELYSATIYPFFGALTAKQQDGYTIIPDGSGALIRYDNEYKNINIPYDKPFFHGDNGIPNATNHDNYNTDYNSHLNFNLYGMVHGINQSGFLNVIEDGGEYGKLVSYPAGVTTNFYFTTTEYIYNNVYQSKLSNTTNITSKLPVRNNINIREKMIFVDDNADYVGIANLYKDYLKDRNWINDFTIENIPLNIDVTSQVLKQGLFTNKMETMTSTNDIVLMEQYFASSGIDNLYFNISADKIDLSGNESDLDKLNTNIEEKYTFEKLNEYLSENNDVAFLTTPYDNIYSDGGSNIDKYVIRAADKYYSQIERKLGNKVYTSSDLTKDGLAYNQNNIVKKLDDYEFTAYKNDSLATPSTNFAKDETQSKRDYVVELVELQTEFKEKDYIVGNTIARDYQLKNTDISFNSPVETTIYQFITDTIPFYSIVLSGNISMYSQGINEYPDLDKMILKCIEYNVYPSFNLIYRDFELLQNSYSGGASRFTVEFQKWNARIVDIYNQINDKLDLVKNQEITNHEVLAPMVSATTYANDITIVVNYSNKDFRYNNVTIPANKSEVIS